jgi:alpha-beta hydrolase superfamily lysophospholipase
MRFSEDLIEKYTGTDGQERKVHIWEPDAPQMVFLTVHGALDHGGNYYLPALYFREHGIATVAPDQQGHDHLGPDMSSKVLISRFEVLLDDLESMVEWVEARYPGLPLYILAHSAGGLIATHFGIRKREAASRIKGFIISSPYYVNAVKTAPILEKVAGILSAVAPRMTVPVEDIVPNLTRDQQIYERHRADQKDGIKATSASARLAGEILKAQAWIPEHIASWNHPTLFIVAGGDKVADFREARKLIGLIKDEHVSELYYRENYHENFNELNREEVFRKVLDWVNSQTNG